MKKIIKTRSTIKLVLMIFPLMILSFCKNEIPPELEEYLSALEKHRAEVNDYMAKDPNSPFNFKGKVEFHDLNYFDINPGMRFISKLSEYETKDTITIYGTKGEARKTVRFAYLNIEYERQSYKLNVYENKSKSGTIYYSIWFTDRTTNDESYGVGRYLNFEKFEDPQHLYEIDFNYAYNPYCAYSKEYSCAIPTKEDYLDISIAAGEKIFHD